MSQEITCPACKHTLRVQDDVKEQRFTCPRCLAPVANPAGPLEQGAGASPPRQPTGVRAADREASGELSQTYWSILVLTVLCILGIAVWLHSAPQSLGTGIFAALALMGLFIILDVLVLIPRGKAIFSRLKPAANPVTDVFKVLGAVFLFLALAVAVVIFFGAACAAVMTFASR